MYREVGFTKSRWLTITGSYIQYSCVAFVITLKFWPLRFRINS